MVKMTKKNGEKVKDVGIKNVKKGVKLKGLEMLRDKKCKKGWMRVTDRKPQCVTGKL